jgi:hypothetical protein
MSPEYVRPYVKAQKNDDLDAAALVAAAGNAWPFGVDGTWRRGSD